VVLTPRPELTRSENRGQPRELEREDHRRFQIERRTRRRQLRRHTVALAPLHRCEERRGADQPDDVPARRRRVRGVRVEGGGAPSNPDWYHNLVANPEATVEIGDDAEKVTARVAGPAEREPIWERQKERYPGFAEYEQRTEREIPVVILDPVT
jgi:deazaflavin-dependent oxidoreductase (nitroreductase family)